MKLIVFFLTYLLFSFNSSRNDYSTLSFIYESSIVIIGQTNVNTFHCQSCNSPALDTLAISYFEDNQNSYLIQHTPIELPVNTFDCGNKMITKDFGKLLQKEMYPALRITLMKVSSVPGKDAMNNGKVEFEIEIAGSKRSYTTGYTSSIDGDEGSVRGELDICISDFNLTAPQKFLGLVKISEDIEIQFNFRVYAQHAVAPD